jgi:putative tricarboxylic transport membrane protein
MGILELLIAGFKIGLEPANLLYCFLGVFLGTLTGVLPGLGPTAAVSLLLPVTFGMSPVAAIIMLAGIYYGTMYGGSTTSILVNIPGETASVVTCLDGYQMALNGRAGPALGIAAFGSFIAGTLGLAGLMLLAQPLAEFSLEFGPAEYFCIISTGLILLSFISRGPMVKSLIIASFGIILSCVGIDIITSKSRMTFDFLELADGVGLVPLVMGIFGISEVLINLEKELKEEGSLLKLKMKELFPTRDDWNKSKWAIVRGSILGFFLGILPGIGTVTSSFFSYAVEKKVSKNPERFGQGMIEGVAGPESANNAATAGAFIPLFTLGIPVNPVMALLFGALLIHGIQPGPLLMQKHPEMFWGPVSSMYIGNIMLLVLNLPLIPLWVQILKIPKRILLPLILLFCIIGAFSLNNSAVEVLIMVLFGMVGYLLRKSGYDMAPLVLGFVLGPTFETNFRQSLLISGGNFSIFLSSPICVVSILIFFAVLIIAIMPRFRLGNI